MIIIDFIDFIDFVSDHGYVRWTNLKHIKKNDHCDRALTSLTLYQIMGTLGGQI